MSVPVLAAIDSSRTAAALRHVDIEFEMEPKLPEVDADGFRLTQIITQLLSNAIKFSPVGEAVLISIKSGAAESAGNSGVNRSENSEAEIDSVIVTVRNLGFGIRESHFDRVFEPFYRITGEGVEGGAGVGLGLTIVKGLVELHSGKVWVHSVPKEFTEFGFSVPLT